MKPMPKSQMLSPPDGKVVEALADPRILATIGGVTLGNAGEKALFRAGRSMFGHAVPAAGGTVKYHPAKADGTADTTQEAPQFRVNRNVARGVGLVGAIAASEFVKDTPTGGVIQFGLLGSASIWACHLIQDLVPALR